MPMTFCARATRMRHRLALRQARDQCQPSGPARRRRCRGSGAWRARCRRRCWRSRRRARSGARRRSRSCSAARARRWRRDRRTPTRGRCSSSPSSALVLSPPMMPARPIAPESSVMHSTDGIDRRPSSLVQQQHLLALAAPAHVDRARAACRGRRRAAAGRARASRSW